MTFKDLNIDFNRIAIHTRNISEKIAALYHLSKLSDIKISDYTLNTAFNDPMIGMEYPDVNIQCDLVASTYCPKGSTEYHIVQFADMNNPLAYVPEQPPIAVALKNGITANVRKNYVEIIIYNPSLVTLAPDDLTKLQQAMAKFV